MVAKLLGMYPAQEPKNPEVYVPLLVIACEGVDLDILKDMVHPRHGIRSKWLPTVEEVVSYLDRKMQARQRQLDQARQELVQLGARIGPPPESHEAKAAALARWDRIKKGQTGEGKAGGEAETPPADPSTP